MATTFESDGTSCGIADGATIGDCWMGPSSTASAIIVNTSSATVGSGSTSTVLFRVNVPNNPSPSIVSGFYTATATLTATTN